MVAIAAGSNRVSASTLRSSQLKNDASRINATLTASAMPAIFLARRQIGDEVEVIQDRERRRKGTNEILAALEIDTVLHADTGVILRQHCGRHTNVANAAMAHGRDQANRVQHGTTADGNHKRMPIDPVLLDPFIIHSIWNSSFLIFSPPETVTAARPVPSSRSGSGVRLDVGQKAGARADDAVVDEHQTAMSSAALKAGHGILEDRIGRIEQAARKVHRVFVADRKTLKIDRRRRPGCSLVQFATVISAILPETQSIACQLTVDQTIIFRRCQVTVKLGQPQLDL